MIADAPSLSQKCVVGLFPELLGVGGVQEAGRLTAIALQGIAAAKGWTIKFLSLNDPPRQHRIGLASRLIDFSGFGRDKLRFALSAMRQVRRFSTMDGVLLAAHPNLSVPADWARRLSPKLKIIVMAHGIEVWQPLSSRRRKALIRADVILAPSYCTANKLCEVQGIPSEKIHRLPWPLNPEFLALTESQEVLHLPKSFPKGKTILTVGRWSANERYKGADELIHVLAELHSTFYDLHLVIVGGGDDLPRLRALSNSVNMQNQVHFFGNLSRHEIAACYAQADIFALPSTGEGFGLVFLEAMAFAKPIVAVVAGGAMDLIQDGVNGFLTPPHDVQRLHQVLRQLLDSASLREELGKGGARIVREKYSFASFQYDLERAIRKAEL